MDASTISKLLNQAHIWHKIDNDTICTKRTRTRIPEINSKVAYLAGIITGDGSLTRIRRKKGGYHYRINIVGHKEYLQYTTTLLNDLFSYKPQVLRDKRKSNCYLINIYNAATFFYFTQLGFAAGRKRNIKVPQIIADNPKLFKHYMLGLIDTDGSVSKNRIHLKQREESFLKELVYLLEKRLSIKSNPPKVNYTKGKPFYYIRFPASLTPDF
jgi:intein/homing endonuclease